MKSILLSEKPQKLTAVYSEATLQELEARAGLCREQFSRADVISRPDRFADTEYIFSTWGMPAFEEDEISRYFPSLRAVFYAAGSVQAFARPFLCRGIKVFSAWAANAVPVAEYTVAQIILANKGFFSSSRIAKSGDRRAASACFSQYKGNYGARVGIIGAGMIGSLVAEMLKAYRLEVLVFDPFLSADRAKALGVKLCSLEELFSTCSVVSNHLANNEQTRGMLNGVLFSSMRPYATFLNTGRGAQVVEDDLVDVLTARPDLTAVLDVTYPEPPAEGHAFYSLPNCVLTPHIAGSSGDEVHRMAEYMKDEFDRLIAGEACRYEVDLKMLETMA